MRKVGIYYAYWTHEWGVDFLPFVKKVKRLGFEILEINGGTLVSVNRDMRWRCRILLDTFHMNIEEDSFGDAIRKAGKYLSALHLREPNRKPREWGGCQGKRSGSR